MKAHQIIESNEDTSKKIYYNFKSYKAAKEQLKNLAAFYKRTGRYSDITIKKDTLTLHHGDNDNITTLMIIAI